MPRSHREIHLVHRVGWLRAAVLGANDGIVSTASLIVGVAAAAATRGDVVLAGLAGLVGGAMSMAAGEYVSVSSQADAEQAELTRERAEIATQPQAELDELTGIYTTRGLDPALAREVAVQLMRNDALGAHARDELGISEATAARPLQAAFASAVSFSAGAALPLAAAFLIPFPLLAPGVATASIACLALLGAVSARAGRAPVAKAVARVTFWGAAAMAATAAVGTAFGVVV